MVLESAMGFAIDDDSLLRYAICGAIDSERMRMAELEQTARRIFRLDPVGQIVWLLPTLTPDLSFARWLDTQDVPFPGEPDRRCDTVAYLVSTGGRYEPRALVCEVEASPRRTQAERFQEYEIRIRNTLRHGPHARDRFQTASVVVLLTGSKRELRIVQDLPGTNLRSEWSGGLRSLAKEDAAATIAGVNAGRFRRSVLLWVPLMRGADGADVARQGVESAKAEADENLRMGLGALAKVFVNRMNRESVWGFYLEGWEMWKSTVIAEWRGEGELKRQKSNLRMILATRFPDASRSELDKWIEAETDLNRLEHWFRIALTSSSIESVREEIERDRAAKPTKPTRRSPKV